MILRWDPRALYRKIFDDPAEMDRFLADVCTVGWHLAHDRGIAFADNRKALIARYPRYEAEILAWGDRFVEMLEPIGETEAMIEALHRAGVVQWALSNISAEVWPQAIALSPAFTKLAGAVLSGEERLLKPDPAIFRVACARMRLSPAEILFVDDSRANIEAAEALGFGTHHFTDPRLIEPELKARGLL